MKTLSEIEPRIAITNLPYTISASGSYYVTTNLTGTGGINISTSHVTLDLGGFTLSGTGNGIAAGTGTNIVIRNGILLNWSGDGVYAFASVNSRFENLQLYGNANIGLHAGIGSVVVNCEASSNTVAGISLAGGEMSHCVALNNAGTGVVTSAGCVVSDCTAKGNGSDGINVGVSSTVRSCVSYQNGGNGITANNNCTVIACNATGNNGEVVGGILCGNGCSVIDCNASDNTGAYGTIYGGISVGNNCSVINCTASGNNAESGIGGFGNNNCSVINCTASGNESAGIIVGNNSTVINCSATANEASGIVVNGNGCLIVGNNSSGNTNNPAGNGIQIGGSQNRIDGNTTANNGYQGIYVVFANVTNSITRNASTGNGFVNYGNYAGNGDYAPTGSVSTTTNPWANF